MSNQTNRSVKESEIDNHLMERVRQAIMSDSEREFLLRYLRVKMNPSQESYIIHFMELFGESVNSIPDDLRVTGEMYLRHYA